LNFEETETPATTSSEPAKKTRASRSVIGKNEPNNFPEKSQAAAKLPVAATETNEETKPETKQTRPSRSVAGKNQPIPLAEDIQQLSDTEPCSGAGANTNKLAAQASVEDDSWAASDLKKAPRESEVQVVEEEEDSLAASDLKKAPRESEVQVVEEEEEEEEDSLAASDLKKSPRESEVQVVEEDEEEESDDADDESGFAGLRLASKLSSPLRPTKTFKITTEPGKIFLL
jgi:hypothetical protein